MNRTVGTFARRLRAGDPQAGSTTVTRGNATSPDSPNGGYAGTYNLLTCLACAQRCGLDFTGMTWVDAQGELGEGGQAVVSQTQTNVETVLAYKRRNSSSIGSRFSRGTTNQKLTLQDIYREIAFEIMALGHPRIRDHPHIVQLHAISWEIQNVASWRHAKDNLRVWPVLVFEKADKGDLLKYVSTHSELDLARRVQLCREIALALAAAHENDIIHGDVKPENVLVFGERENVTAKLADFGFAGLGVDQEIKLARTEPWAAPEVYARRVHSLPDSKLTDVYSFGMLCLWVIFRETLVSAQQQDSDGAVFTNPASKWRSLRGSLKATKSTDPGAKAIDSQKRLGRDGKALQQKSLSLCDGLKDSPFQSSLRRMFECTLSVHSGSRIISSPGAIFEDIVKLLDKARYARPCNMVLFTR
jgi:serine/threonine protein kinase